MKDEEFVFRQDCNEKKVIARSANKRVGRTHKVTLPSDYLSKKELKAMSGDVKSYRPNSPMQWDEFKAMPDDLKCTYIKLLRAKFNVPDSSIADMMGIHQTTLSDRLRTLGFSRVSRGRSTKWDRETWLKWVNGIPNAAPDQPEETPDASASLDAGIAPVAEIETLPTPDSKAKVIPNTGSLALEGRLEDVMNTVTGLLGGAKVSLCISWQVCPEEGVCEDGRS